MQRWNVREHDDGVRRGRMLGRGAQPSNSGEGIPCIFIALFVYSSVMQTRQTEFTLSKTNVDFYDVSILNGYNIAVEMAPVPPFSINESLPYNCGNPGWNDH